MSGIRWSQWSIEYACDDGCRCKICELERPRTVAPKGHGAELKHIGIGEGNARKRKVPGADSIG